MKGLWTDLDIEAFRVTWDREFWVSDPGPFMPICMEMGVTNFVFRAKWLDMRNMRQDFRKFIELYARGQDWRALYVPYPEREAVLFTSRRGLNQHEAVWPIWRADTDKFSSLDELWEARQDAGDFVARMKGETYESLGSQEHRVIVAGMPSSSHEWAEIALKIQRLQVEHPEWTIHTHGQKSLGRTIGIGVKSFDHTVRLGWDDGLPRILLPNGMIWRTANESSRTMDHWLRVIGRGPNDFRFKGKSRETISNIVYETNLRSLRWAFLNWERAWNFRRMAEDEEDMESAEIDWDPRTLPVRMKTRKGPHSDLDKWLCDTCSLQFKCPYSREGAVCIVPDSEPVQLAELFGTRSSIQILEGLSTILATQAHRVNRALLRENEKAEEPDKDGNVPGFKLDPALTRLINTLFDRGVQMAKLVDPRIAAQLGTKVNVNILQAGQPGSGFTPQALMAGVAGELERRGIALADATPEMIQEIMLESIPNPVAIEVTSHEETKNEN